MKWEHVVDDDGVYKGISMDDENESSGDWEVNWGEIEPSYRMIKKKSKCECGAVAAGTPFHSDWCPIYVDPMKAKDNDES